MTKTSAFITFDTIDQRNFFLQKNPNHALNTLKRIFPCYEDPERFCVSKGSEYFTNILIYPAPEPEDVIWGNIGMNTFELFCRLFFSSIATLVILGIAFVIVYGLSTVQQNEKKRRYISVIISLVISGFNLLIISTSASIQKLCSF